MLRRCQVLLTDWLEEHMKLIAKRADISFSEMIRIMLCYGVLRTAPEVFPECKTKVDKKLLTNLTREATNLKTQLERKYQLASRLYFETRKLIEYLDPKIIEELRNKY